MLSLEEQEENTSPSREDSQEHEYNSEKKLTMEDRKAKLQQLKKDSLRLPTKTDSRS